MRWVLIAMVACGSDPAPPGGGDHPDGDSGASDAPAGGPNGCRARDCGPDGAGGSCGTCGATFVCDDNLGLCIPNNGADVDVTFQGTCWYLCPDGVTYCTPGSRYQALEFRLGSDYPIEATLYFDDT